MTPQPSPLPRPPPRQGPRPLPLHMAMEGWILQMSFAGLMSSNAALPSLKLEFPLGITAGLQANLLNPLRALVAAVGGPNQAPDTPWSALLEPAPFIDALTREATGRMENFMAGVRAYQIHGFRRTLETPPPAWRRGAAQLIDYGGEGTPVIFVPSLINRAYILDLSADRSLMRATAAAGLHAYLLDWGEPADAERAFTIADYIEGVLIPALEEIKARTGTAPAVVGYCLGGTLSVAPAVLRPDLVSALVLLAAPWDYQNDNEASRVLLEFSRPMFEVVLGAEGVLSIDFLQALFASLDPTLVGRKFRRFAELNPASEPARRFVELEDWLNDGVPLAGPVAREVLFDWYGKNDPHLRRWKIDGVVIDPARVACPTLAFIPTQDRIVPPGSARALTDAIPGARAVSVDLGHIGMVSAGGAPRLVYEPLIAWLKNPTKP